MYNVKVSACMFFLLAACNRGSLQQELDFLLLFPVPVRILDASIRSPLCLGEQRKLHWRWPYTDEKHLSRPCLVPGVFVLPMAMEPTRTHSPNSSTFRSRRIHASC